MTIGTPTGDPLRVLAVTQGLWGNRIAANVRRHAPSGWSVASWQAPAPLPLVIDDPDEFLPAELPATDLLLALGEVPGMGQLVPDIVRRSKARSVIVAIDHTTAVPPGLESQLRAWLAAMGVTAVFPKPLCSLTETSSGVHRRLSSHDDPFIRAFASRFGRPEFHLTVQHGRVVQAQVARDSACGCARHVAEGLSGCPVDDAVETAGMLHHHFPCLASMVQDPDYLDTLMHVSGHLVRRAVQQELEEHLAPVPYLRPAGRVEPARQDEVH